MLQRRKPNGKVEGGNGAASCCNARIPERRAWLRTARTERAAGTRAGTRQPVRSTGNGGQRRKCFRLCALRRRRSGCPDAHACDIHHADRQLLRDLNQMCDFVEIQISSMMNEGLGKKKSAHCSLLRLLEGEREDRRRRPAPPFGRPALVPQALSKTHRASHPAILRLWWRLEPSMTATRATRAATAREARRSSAEHQHELSGGRSGPDVAAGSPAPHAHRVLRRGRGPPRLRAGGMGPTRSACRRSSAITGQQYVTEPVDAHTPSTLPLPQMTPAGSPSDLRADRGGGQERTPGDADAFELVGEDRPDHGADAATLPGSCWCSGRDHSLAVLVRAWLSWRRWRAPSLPPSRLQGRAGGSWIGFDKSLGNENDGCSKAEREKTFVAYLKDVEAGGGEGERTRCSNEARSPSAIGPAGRTG